MNEPYSSYHYDAKSLLDPYAPENADVAFGEDMITNRMQLLQRVQDLKEENIRLSEDKRSLLIQLHDFREKKDQIFIDVQEKEEEDISEIKNKMLTDNIREREKLNLPLKKMVDEEMPCCCGAAEREMKIKTRYAEVLKVNHYWEKDYTALMDELNNLKAQNWKIQSELRLKQQECNELSTELTQKNKMEELNVNQPLTDNTKFTLDDLEALKQQLIIYKEDYTAEKEDNRKLTEELNKMKLELQKAHGIIDGLTLKNTTIKENFRRVSQEKEHIVNELRRLSTSTLPFSPVYSGGRRIGSNESFETLRSEDIIAHSGSNIRLPSSLRGRGYVERDVGKSPTQGRTSPFNLNLGRISPSNQFETRTQTNHSPKRLSPTNHIDYKDFSSINDDLRSL